MPESDDLLFYYASLVILSLGVLALIFARFAQQRRPRATIILFD
jgi:hypothetical protein